MMRFLTILSVLWLLAAFAANDLQAAYYKQSESDIDPSVFKIDEKSALGYKVEGQYRLIDMNGREFDLKELRGKPTILVFSYYTCDGSCSAINDDLLGLLITLEEMKSLKIGKDFNVLTLSFDKNDTRETLAEFRDKLKLPKDLQDNWTFAVAKDFVDVQELADNIGYKFFWSPQDRTFFHPGAFVFLTPEGRVSRILYALANEAKDVELAVLEAKQGKFKPSEIVNYAVSLCYSYNYKEGRYTYNIPLFVAMGSLTLGVTAFSGSVIVFKRRRKKKLLEGS